MELHHRLTEHVQYRRPPGGEVIVATTPFAVSYGRLGFQPAIAFQPFEQRIERARTDVVAVTPEFGEHPLSDDRMLSRVMQDMDLPDAEQDLSGEQLSVVRGNRHNRPR